MSNIETNPEYPTLGDYVTCFIDVLGQRAELRGQSLMPQPANQVEIELLRKKVRSTVGMVGLLQTHTERIHNGLMTRLADAKLNSGDGTTNLLDETCIQSIKQQRWSDGIMLFSRLRDRQQNIRTETILHLIFMTGFNFLLQLSRQSAIRGGIDIGWASELRSGELYGSAVARAYELESEVAQYPRIVVGQTVVQQLDDILKLEAQDPNTAINQGAAQMALGFMSPDIDGMYIVDYLGQGFGKCVEGTGYDSLIEQAMEFVRSQLDRYQRERNTKLAFRYALLNAYFTSRLNN